MSKYKGIVVKGSLVASQRSNTQAGRRPGARPIIDSGEAYKTVYLSKAPASMKREDMEKALDYHIKIMQKEVQQDGKQVTKIIKTLYGIDGDARIVMKWVVLGTKNTKAARRAGNVGVKQALEAEPGRVATQKEALQDSVPL